MDNECAAVGDTYLLTVILCDSFSARGLLAGIRLPIESSITFFEPLQSYVLSKGKYSRVIEAEVAFRTHTLQRRTKTQILFKETAVRSNFIRIERNGGMQKVLWTGEKARLTACNAFPTRTRRRTRRPFLGGRKVIWATTKSRSFSRERNAAATSFVTSFRRRRLGSCEKNRKQS